MQKEKEKKKERETNRFFFLIEKIHYLYCNILLGKPFIQHDPRGLSSTSAINKPN